MTSPTTSRSVPAHAPRGLSVRASSATEGLRIWLAGELDVSTAPSLRDQRVLLPEAHDVASVVLDLCQLAFCDATGAGALVSLWDAHTAAHRHVTVVGACRSVRTALQALGVDQTLFAT